MLSNTCKYALRALIYMAKYSGDESRIGIKKISADLSLSSPFLGKILQNLVKQKLLVSTKGPNGGFSLSKPPGEISLWDIVINVDGEEYFTNCLIGLRPCKAHDTSKPFCPVHFKYEELRKVTTEFYKETSLKIIADDIEKFEDLVRL
ncbi:MAG: Rrf2 family transcriptional regulator [Prolixibacteraceae bacterium]|nr:Rrf2 family transcriptional regulator [Prolixibacteraceae bacterium]NLX28568.1 Rrf2 family transcriptional regulator [Bacteroidales bacterium]HNQ37797.1 Rrf2 family transcriptional regulator [Prolixibacteraceae bacterium]HOY50112.1 Rrf2 family transcriptional regulator [Prolixibacteraceae bacterium]HPJ77952.1 Rrf2 family transcriptional regulator [Prolixibacteraceae bacterium]